MLSGFHPAVSKACSRCHARKVKCDLRVPRCSACIRQNDECNITECVFYPYSALRSLQEHIDELEARASIVPGGTNGTDPGLMGESSAAVSLSGIPANNRNHNGEETLQKEAEEVGVLAIGGSNPYSENKYVGSAAGSTFARIFFKQINFTPPSASDQQAGSLNQCFPERNAALPPHNVARSLLAIYIRRVHVWWPVLQLPYLRRTFQRIYQNPRQCNDYEKFLIFIVLALSSSDLSKSEENSAASMDLNEPSAYFSASLQFFAAFHDHSRDIFGIQAILLLAIWMLNSASSSHTNDLWQVSRYVMSAAIEAGLHRHNTNWGFSSEELETRNRTWWCAYNLERQVATVTGRVLSIRDHAIHAKLPNASTFDNLTQAESLEAPIFHKLNIAIFKHMVGLRRIGGRILESIYIARGPDGKAMQTSFQEICVTSDKVRQDLEQWKDELDRMELKPSREYSEMKIEYSLLELLLHRPSPTFMVPSRQMIFRCSKAASSAVRQWSKIDANHGISAVCRCFRQLHDILLVGLAALYCDWQVTTIANQRDQNTRRVYRHFDDTSTCLDLMERGISHMKASHLIRYREIFLAARNKVYADTMFLDTSPNEMASQRSTTSFSREFYDLFGNPTGEDFEYMNTGMEAYVNQVNEFLDVENFGMDEAINSWYDALMAEMNDNRMEPAF